MHYQVKALRQGEAVALLACEAQDALAATSQVESQGYTVLSVTPQALWNGWRVRLGSRFHLVLFSQELLSLLDAGLSLVESIETLAEKEHRAEHRKLLRQIIAKLYEGQPLSFALQQFPAVFPPLYVASVRASEKTGDLSEALTRYVAYQARVDLVRKRIVSASIYPMLLIFAGSLVTLFLLLYVVPKFARIYEDIGGEMPFFSQILMAWGRLLEAHKFEVLVIFLAVLAGLVYWVTRPGFGRFAMQLLWRLPAVGERLMIYQLARFYRTLGMLLRGGIPVVTALDMVSGLLQPALRVRLAGAAKSIREGQAISLAMENHGLTSPVAQRMLRVGERTGDMGEMMDRIAAFYDEEMSRWVDWFTRLFEPLLMAFIGLVIGLIVVLMYFPIFELAGSIQ
ncbi:MAG: type II secretion system F family protein [Gallionellaceae bacterium]|nr:type II secretion system F family protein [Gallionellaceae bacterium]